MTSDARRPRSVRSAIGAPSLFADGRDGRTEAEECTALSVQWMTMTRHCSARALPRRRVAAIKSELEDIMSTVKSAHCDPSVVLVCDRTGGRGRAAATATTAEQHCSSCVGVDRARGKIAFRLCYFAPLNEGHGRIHFLLFARVCEDMTCPAAPSLSDRRRPRPRA